MTWSNEVTSFADSSIKIGGKEFPTKIGDLAQASLIFYSENPRVYTTINAAEVDPDQKTIEDHLCSAPHVQKLKREIVHHEGLLEAIIVRDKTFDVLEGNSRLAAYRLLQGKREYQTMRCTVLPHDIPDKYIFSYLGQIHINGKTPWAAHEKARYLQREEAKRGDLKMIAEAIGVGPRDANNMVKSIGLMQQYGDTENENFSYYMAYLGNQAAQKAVKSYPKLEQTIVSEIKRKPFKKAQDFRAALTPVCSDRTALNKFLTGKLDLPEANEFVDNKGSKTEAGKKVKSAALALSTIERPHLNTITAPQLNKVEADLKKIKRSTDSLLKIIKNIKNSEVAE